jgi:hypothetical protein
VTGRTTSRWAAVCGAAVLTFTLLSGSPAAAAQPSIGPAPIQQTPVLSGGSVTVTWIDKTTLEDAFVVVRRRTDGQWQNVADLVTANKAGVGGMTSWVDTSPNELKCYEVWAYDWNASYEISMSADLCVGGSPDPFDPNTPMTPPTLNTPVASGASVSLSWTDRSVSEDAFVVVRRRTDGQWQNIADIATSSKFGTGATLTWTDNAPTPSNQCYEVWSYAYVGGDIGFSADVCVGNASDIFSGPVTAPATPTLTTFVSSVAVNWVDPATNESTFLVQKRDGSGNWQTIQQVPTRNTISQGDPYTWMDTDRSQSGQCYRVAATNNVSTSYSAERCTVRPDASRFPQNVPAGAVEWSGLSSVNDGTGTLLNHANNQHLYFSSRLLGVDLDFQDSPSLWKVEAQGGPQLMKGQAVALRVWGGGWLKTGSPVFGIGLDLDLNTPSYEWYVVGGGSPGTPLNSGTFALWNSVRSDYLVYDGGAGTGVVKLLWYGQTGGTPPPTQGVKTYRLFNCSVQQHAVEVWVADQTAGGAFVDRGSVNQQYGPGGCVAPGSVPFTFTPVSGHHYRVVATDRTLPACGGIDNPQVGACQKMVTEFNGDASGYTRTDTVDIGTQITPG